MLDAFEASSSLDHDKLKPAHERMRIGIVHVGAPAGGMNAATRQAVRYCLSRGHTPVAIYNGFNGLLQDNVSELDWLRVDGWTTRGGSELGTNRTLPDVNLGHVALQFQKYQFDGFLLIGGFEAYNSLAILEQARANYPSFHIPMVHLPATISNNVPLTEFSLGSDTSLNALVDACDAIKQSASASRNRVFVVETAGGKCGYIAALGALAVGAVIVYTPEVGISLDLLRSDVRFLRRRYELDQKGKSEGRLIIRCVRARAASCLVLPADVMADRTAPPSPPPATRSPRRSTRPSSSPTSSRRRVPSCSTRARPRSATRSRAASRRRSTARAPSASRAAASSSSRSTTSPRRRRPRPGRPPGARRPSRACRRRATSRSRPPSSRSRVPRSSLRRSRTPLSRPT